jgi:anthranilate synthase component 1
MQKYLINTSSVVRLADTFTPVGVFLKLRDKFKNTAMLESADYHGKEHGFSHIACKPMASFVLDDSQVTQTFPDGSIEKYTLNTRKDAVDAMRAFADRFDWKREKGFSAMANGMFGHITYDSVEYFEDIEIQAKNSETAIPQIVYFVYQYVIAFNHFKDELHLYCHQNDANPDPEVSLSNLEMLLSWPYFQPKSFKKIGEEQSNLTDAQMETTIQQCINHCLRGDVFQIVPSRRFAQKFEGDDFQVYRALRSINPSPYLFYFDFENYKIFGASPEKQIAIKGNIAEIHPIAGTYRRTGNDERDAELARELHADAKESAEHVMLVDLARNDLSRSTDTVKVETFKEVQFYSHVIHLVSKVTGNMVAGTNPLQLVADTFPAGTLSGAPKHNAMTLIDKYETTNRSIYGGAVGYMDFNGNFNHAIAIRTFLSKNQTLFLQAGMGVVAKSVIESEMKEVGIKLGALRKAMELAEVV